MRNPLAHDDIPDNILNVKPFKHKVLVHAYPAPEETKTKGGIVIPKRAREAELEAGIRAQVIAVGDGCHPDIKPGDWVLIARFSGTVVVHDRLGDPDAAYVLIIEDSIICWLDSDYTMRELGIIGDKRKSA